MVKKIFLDCRNEFVKGSEDLQAGSIEITPNARYTAQENGRAKWMTSTMKNGNQKLLIKAGTPKTF